ncbi:hypothetical protein EBR66_01695 [bacterium]|nr:hypothetical protein [bacterium]
MHREIFEPHTEAVFKLLAQSSAVTPNTGFYLAGGTALALQRGHRRSVDLDFFIHNDVLPERITEQLEKLGTLTVTQEEQKTINASLNDVKVSFISFPYPLLFPTKEWDGVSLADERDVAAMKLSAIAGRGAKKDFFDMNELLKTYSLEQMIHFFEQKFAGKNYNTLHILKSISYFVDADVEPDPIMLQKVSWDEVKSALSKEAHALVD